MIFVQLKDIYYKIEPKLQIIVDAVQQVDEDGIKWFSGFIY